MKYTASFQRIEKKYLLNAAQLEAFIPKLTEHMEQDEYGLTTICNLYLDTPDDLLVRRSIEKPKYKEKMRLRSYGVPGDQDRVFLEIKKKAAGMVYKRRVDLTLQQAMDYLVEGKPLPMDNQIAREIDYMKNRYGLAPKEYLAYDRVAYREIEESRHAVRVTIDHNIRARQTDVDLRMGDAGKLLLPEDAYLMEIKTLAAYPLWLSAALATAKAQPVSFSKVGQVYRQLIHSRPRASLYGRSSKKNLLNAGGYVHAFYPI